MKKILFASLILLAGCTTTKPPVLDIGEAPPTKIPNLPPQITKADRLPDITDGSLEGINRSGIDADKRYNEVALRYNYLIDVYTCMQAAIADNSSELFDVCIEGAPK